MNSVKRHICDVTKSQLRQDLPSSVNNRDFTISPVFYFHETSHLMRNFVKIKLSRKISEFTVSSII